ncbi:MULTISPECIES: response regulator transcription factor [unclassified Flavobacterium]|uniref:response regulator transcription factor n=1 Tax=unclassified Flavobacterium TaxID=196869 RepID=UPI001F148EB9|nr:MULTISPECIES: response regulator transcription factor [unclassified Flavobacterium]UMY66869.1 response regulator transcription factor [Flavobacterium sp. HJ-32-4]
MARPLVLIVEDELIIALDIKEILEEEGYEARINITSVDDAIAAIRESKPALVLIDINLKQAKDGIDLGTFLLQDDTVPFLYITSYSDKTTLERASETRPYGYIVKPFKRADLITTVSIVLNNFRHRHIDVMRQDKEITDDIPFILKQSIRYINENITERIKITDLAAQTRWESQHYNRMFTKYVGMTPYQYIIEKKIDKAKTLLTETDIPIVQISFDVGFKSHSNFCALFKRATGKTPQAFRKWQEVQRRYLPE